MNEGEGGKPRYSASINRGADAPSAAILAISPRIDEIEESPSDRSGHASSSIRSSAVTPTNAESSGRDQFRKFLQSESDPAALSRKSADKASAAPVPLPVQFELEHEGDDVTGSVAWSEDEKEEGEEQDYLSYAQETFEEGISDPTFAPHFHHLASPLGACPLRNTDK